MDVLHASQKYSFNILVTINVVGIPGRLLPAYVADRYLGALNTVIPIILRAALCVYSWNAVRSFEWPVCLSLHLWLFLAQLSKVVCKHRVYNCPKALQGPVQE